MNTGDLWNATTHFYSDHAALIILLSMALSVVITRREILNAAGKAGFNAEELLLHAAFVALAICPFFIVPARSVTGVLPWTQFLTEIGLFSAIFFMAFYWNERGRSERRRIAQEKGIVAALRSLLQRDGVRIVTMSAILPIFVVYLRMVLDAAPH